MHAHKTNTFLRNMQKIHIKDLRRIVEKYKRAKSSLFQQEVNRLLKFNKSINNREIEKQMPEDRAK